MYRLVRSASSVLVLGLLLSVSPTVSGAVEGRPCAAEPTFDMPITYGDVITGANCEITPAGDLDSFQFSGAAGERIRFAGKIEPGGDPGELCAELYGPTPGDPPIASACSWIFVGQDFLTIDAILPQAATYTLVMTNPLMSSTLRYALSLARLFPTPEDARPINPGQILADEVNPRPDLDTFKFTGKAGDVLRVNALITGGDTDVCVELIGPDGVTANSACSWIFVGNTVAAFDQTLTQDGIHTLLVNTFGYNAPLTYDLSLQCLLGACPSLPCTLFARPSHNAGTLTLAFDLGSLQAAQWNVWVSVSTFVRPLWSVAIPVVNPPIPVSIPIAGISNLGNLGILTTLTTPTAGIICSDWATVDTGPRPAGAKELTEDEVSRILPRRPFLSLGSKPN